ncbi:MAG: nucleoside 2-deoxyribosyltransferase [Spirochaetes bacterium]|nr:nucleoside 2-deoxyribosyltransferase [Spirochaetota bacterium]
MNDRPLIYCSGPLFCRGEIDAMAGIARVLEDAGYETFLPHRDGLEAFVTGKTDDYLSNLCTPLVRLMHHLAFCVDLYYILKCDCMVMNMNGRVPDEGGVAETGMAFAAGKPVVLYCDDTRAPFQGVPDPMVLGVSALWAPVDRIEKIPGAVARLSKDFIPVSDADPPAWTGGLSPDFRKKALRGRRTARILKRLSFLKPADLF